MDKPKKHKMVLSKDALQDIKNTKTYIFTATELKKQSYYVHDYMYEEVRLLLRQQ